MAKEFWSELLTQDSWLELLKLAKEFDFILIGGWAAFLHTSLHKSKDIDIVVDYETLDALRRQYRLEKNERLKKYEVKRDKFDIDVYVPHYSQLSIPVEQLERYSVKIQGIKTVSAEALLVLKQGAEIERRNSVKGQKDAIDILTIISRAGIDWKKYAEILSKHGKHLYPSELLRVLRDFPDDDIEYLGMSFTEFKKWKKLLLAELKQLQ
ncbi:hypothetical protein HY992_04395 [Candidatus Micrarchaeota archaeon]|nr:hypothetical protein [Candidatus Micrarchaeota archaeon]